MTDTAVVVAAGDGPQLPVWLAPEPPFTVVAADGGLHRAAALGLPVDLAVGDFDSAGADAVAAAEAGGARVVTHPVAKDATDLELAIEAALALAPRRLLVIASAGGRLDHLLAACLCLGSHALDGVEVDALVGEAVIHVVRDRRMFRGRAGELLTLVPVGGDALGVRTEGLAYPLAGETLASSSSRGVSNLLVAPEATVSVEQGVLLAIRPEPGEVPR